MRRVPKQAETAAETGIPSADVPMRYRELLIEYRHSQLQLTSQNLARLEAVFDAAAESLTGKLESATPESLAAAQFSALLSDMEATAAALRGDYAQLLESGMSELAQHAADRERATAALVGAAEDPRLLPEITKTLTLSDQARVTVAFGRLARSAVERMAHKVYVDGWQLSDRLYRLDSNLRETIRQTLVQGVAEQISARTMAGRLRESLTAAGADNPRYQAMRIARTEIVTAHREAHIQSTLDEAGKLKDYILAVGWRLSLSHPHIDICDVWAEDDGDGLGEGNYLPDNVPSDHPHGLCYTTTVLVDYPDVSAPSKAPRAEEAPESQVQYYLDRNDDGPARRWLDKRAA